ncbi:serine protease [Arcticibacterium luteifluviistationis]|uniref:Serine protease n=1 Tax=Arcticibacterium luteifluviistationis TaxID=1784714 RepID=A0A2Z4G863_9BACT|nr:serine protease [Arcticibacterium luteifluviistationis]AWV97389.1 serine protease [Arcticibacterium luteifluviistationis]
MDFLDSLEPVLRTFWYIAIPTSLIFLIQTILTFVGADAMDGIEADFDSDFGDTDAPFQLFSLRNLINFLLGFSWTGISFYEYIVNDWLLIIAAVAVGLLFVFFFLLIIRQVQKLAEDNTFKIQNTLNKNAEVYMNIPGQMKGKGKVLISINGTTRELAAMTRENTLLAGTVVIVNEIKDSILIVTPI